MPTSSTNDGEIRLECTQYEWIGGKEDEPGDQCAHSPVRFSAGGVEFVSPDDGQWTVSATALYLLRTLEYDHLPSSSVTDGNQLFPCCAFDALTQGGDMPALFIGCNNGIEVWIESVDETVCIESDRGRAVVHMDVWQRAVVRFVDSVWEFYGRCSPKETPDDDQSAIGWAAFWQEFRSRSRDAGAFS